jgi:hypothetical protein
LTEEFKEDFFFGGSDRFCCFSEAASVRGVASPDDAFACFTLAVSFDLSELMSHLLE